MENKIPSIIILIVGLVLFAIGIVMGRYFPVVHPNLVYFVKYGSIGALTVGIMNLWLVKPAPRKRESKS